MMFYFPNMNCFIRTNNALVIAEIEKHGNAQRVLSTADVTDSPAHFRSTRPDLQLSGTEYGEPMAIKTPNYSKGLKP